MERQQPERWILRQPRLILRAAPIVLPRTRFLYSHPEAPIPLQNRRSIECNKWEAHNWHMDTLTANILRMTSHLWFNCAGNKIIIY